MSAFPQPIAPSTVKIGSIQPTLVSTAQNLTRQVRSRGAHRWTISAKWDVLLRGEWSAMMGFAQSLRGQFNTCTFVLPGNLSNPVGVASGVPVVNGAGQTGRSVATSGWTPNTTGVLKAGDVVKFAANKVYMLTADAASDAGGNATLAIEPALFVSPANGETVVASGVSFTVALTADTLESNVIPGGFYDFGVSFVEVP